MTRINLIDPKYLTNRHLVAEYKEIRNIASSLRRSSRSPNFSKIKIPEKFILNKGHVLFFYNKGSYIFKRFLSIQKEMLGRGFKLNPDKIEMDCDIFHKYSFYNNWEPVKEDIELVCKRIETRILSKPHLYKDKDKFLDYIKNLNS